MDLGFMDSPSASWFPALRSIRWTHENMLVKLFYRFRTDLTPSETLAEVLMETDNRMEGWLCADNYVPPAVLSLDYLGPGY